MSRGIANRKPSDTSSRTAPSAEAASGKAAAGVLDLCARIAAHTDVPGTITRTFLSPATRDVHHLLRTEMAALGMTVRTDAAGNLRGLYPAQSAGARTLLLGSHIDTVPHAGAYDGILGVALPIALIRLLNGRRLPYAIEIIAFSEEEGVRFRFPFIGSRALVGTLTAADLARTDAEGITIEQAIRNFGLNPDGLVSTPARTGSWNPGESEPRLSAGTFAFLEVHIEQGPVLDSMNLPLGLVTTIVGQSRLALTFQGEANHAGTTPMVFRRDALAAAAQWIAEVESYPENIGDPDLLATVGSIAAKPNAANVIPGTVTVSLDVRHPADAVRLAAVNSLRDRAEAIAASRSLTLTVEDRGGQASVPMDAGLTARLAAAAPGAYPMASGAGHDAMILAPHVPSAMLFVRSPGGLSHNPAETVLAADIAAALTACLRLLETLP